MGEGSAGGLRIVTCNVLPVAFGLVADWARRAGHRIVLVVTSPGPPARRSEGYREIVATAGAENIDVLVTTRLRRVAAPLIAALRPDLLLSATFPHRLPPEVTRLPRLGAVNLHPSPLPVYRGPNPLRLIYDGYPTLGATLHWTDAEFDTGNILSQHTAPVPADLTAETMMAAWFPTMQAALAEGVARAEAGAPGTPQDETAASYSPEFSDAERWLDWTEPAATVRRRAMTLTFLGSPARGMIDGRAYAVRAVAQAGDAGGASPGALLGWRDGEALVAAADGALRLTVAPLDERAP